MRDRFLQVKKLVIEAVLWAESELRNRTGAEKKQAVMQKVLDTLGSMLPWYVRWATTFVSVDMISSIIDAAVRSLNFMSGWNFGGTELSEDDICKLAMVIDTPLPVVIGVCHGQPIQECINTLYDEHGVCPTPYPTADEIIMPPTYQQDTQLSRNLLRSEITCRCGCGFDAIQPEAVVLFQAIRDYIGRPIRITSGCRCPDHNTRVGGAARSYHMQGAALDMQVSGLSARQFGALIREAHRVCPIVVRHLRFCYLMATAVHIDTGRARNDVWGW